MTNPGPGNTVNLVVLGVASSAGTHYAGQERAPAALRRAGLLDRLAAAGLSVEDRGDIVTEVFAVDHANPSRRNFSAVLRTARLVAEAVHGVVAGGAVPVVLGGDCTITLGVVAGVRRLYTNAGLFYFDGDADLATPEATSSGVLDAMGIAHLIGLTNNELSTLGGHLPMLPSERLVLFGIDETDPESFREQALRDHPSLRLYPDSMVRQDPAGSARNALDGLSNGAGTILHFDVDAIDSGDLPLANYPHYGTGVSLDAAARALAVVAGAPDLTAIVLTEVNPTHDPDGRQLRRYADAVGGALAAGLVRAR
jgi:arginase